MKSRRIKKLRYNGRVLQKLRGQRHFQAFWDDFAACARKKMENQLINQWCGFFPENPPESTGTILTKLHFDKLADQFGIQHP